MNKTALLMLGLVINITIQAQNFVVTTPQYRNVVLEEYTGIHCGYCPDGHARAEALATDNPGRVVLINIHQGNFANPGAGEPDFRTIWGDSLAMLANVSGYPNGTVNRHLFPDIEPNKTAMGRSAWFKAAGSIFPLQSTVNIGFKSNFDSLTRVLTVEVEVYYTESSQESFNYLNIAFLENHVFGYQSDYANGAHNNYDHKHILRHLITGQWGDKILNTAKGSLFTKTYQYTVPSGFKIDNCDIAVFVSEKKNEIYSGVVAEANGGSHNGQTKLYVGDVLNTGVKFEKSSSGVQKMFNMQLLSKLAGSEDFKISIESDAPTGWDISFEVDGNTYTKDVVLSLTGNVQKTVKVIVKPGSTPFLTTINLLMQPIKYPDIQRKQTVYYMSDVTELIINNSSPWGNGGDTSAAVFQKAFIDGLIYAGCNTYGYGNTEFINLTVNTDFLDGVKNIYYNVGWSFPSFTETLVEVFTDFINNGGNILVSGQDIGWDNFDNKGYGTDKTKAFVTNYLKASYISDGDQTNNNLSKITTDVVFGQVTNSQIVNVYGVNPDNNTPYMYPDVIDPVSGGKAIFNYNNNTAKVAAVRSLGQSFKTVYLGVSLEMIAAEASRNEIMKNAYDWFNGKLTDIEFDENMKNVFGCYPNPAQSFISFDNKSDERVDLILFDVFGKQVFSSQFSSGIHQIDIGNLPSGVYIVKITDIKGNIKTERFQKID